MTIFNIGPKNSVTLGTPHFFNPFLWICYTFSMQKSGERVTLFFKMRSFLKWFKYFSTYWNGNTFWLSIAVRKGTYYFYLEHSIKQETALNMCFFVLLIKIDYWIFSNCAMILHRLYICAWFNLHFDMTSEQSFVTKNISCILEL